MKQIIEPNINIPYVGGLCEGYVEGMWGQATLPYKNKYGKWETDGIWGNAVSPVNRGETGKWDSNPGNGNHPNELPPMGVKVPVYFWLGSTPAGHTATWLGDGRVISSSQDGYHKSGMIHKSIQALIDYYAPSNNGCKYLGYSTYVGNIKVIGEDMIIENNAYWKARCDRSFQMIRGVGMNDQQFKEWVGKEFLYFIEALEDDKSAETALNWQRLGKKASDGNWEGKLKADSVTIKELKDEIKKLKDNDQTKKLEQIKAIVNA